MKNRITTAFHEAQGQEKPLLIPYLTLGDPQLSVSEEIILGLDQLGIQIIELGLPFSDPMADGPVLMKAHGRACQNHYTQADIFAFIKQLRMKGVKAAFVLFTYFNPALQWGLEKFAHAAAEAGIDGILIVDCPFEESAEWLNICQNHKLSPILLVAPTTSSQRLGQMAPQLSGFLYYISRLGTTGEQTTLSTSLIQELESLKRSVSVPIAVGFGFSSPQQFQLMSGHVAAVVVGSHFVKCFEATLSSSAYVKEVERWLKEA